MSQHSNSATLDLPPSLSCLHPTFNVSLFKPYCPSNPSLCPSANPQPPPIYSDATGDYYLFERIVAERRRCDQPKYTVKWVCWGHSHNTKFLHYKLEAKPGSSMAIAAWQASNTSIPTAAPLDCAARHCYWGPSAQAPPVTPPPPPPPVVPQPPPPALVPPPVVPQPPVIPVAPQAPALRTGRIPCPVSLHKP
eukprot:306479-Rhodomonas_salina.1